MKYIVFTDLDGTLIDHNTYSYEPARPAIEMLKQRNIPLIFCTSKTRAEIEVYVHELESSHPFISENGGAIFIPKDYFSGDVPTSKTEGNYDIIELGTAYGTLRHVLADIRTYENMDITGFGDMDDKGVSEDTGLDIASARLAKMREYDEAFRLNGDENTANRLKQEIQEKGLNYTRGGRYWHILGDNDKGKAVNILTRLYKKEYGEIRTVGLGDSLNDLPMLRAVDVPVLVQKQNGEHDPMIKDPEIKRVEGIGPVGWNMAVKEIIL
ncbi:mannosyl-3-phosphoglycerate phosphatase [Methanolobus halotolerans]|uniref:Mannosyl-3-phosphoglycerate phosphatase n=1 Tax=Methanolobus halotolerans TaxID=2052935 RepID=A0A4E0Q6Z6_9EURY|nr:mannosyl-3-phosphoglycerate phosphatase [Methanolobus halotolerans]TGC10563.1 mannosyl-3-phosphoglycerate phosphatase [Methanolobus halotolerans]